MTRAAEYPAWLTEPVGMDGAAAALGISRRTLTEWLKTCPFYESRGRKKVFYPEHIDQLRREISKCACKSDGSTAGPMPTAPARTAGGSDALSKLVILAERRKRGRS